MARSDKWKLKSWYSVLAPKIFEEKKVGEVLVLEEDTLMNRKIPVHLADLTGDMSHAYSQLVLRVKDVKGKTAYTQLVGFALSRSYVKTLARRRVSLIDNVVKVKTKDGRDMVVKTITVTASRVSRDTKTAIRKRVEEVVRERASKEDYDSFIQEIMFKKLSSKIYGSVKELAPIKRVEVIKTELVEKF